MFASGVLVFVGWSNFFEYKFKLYSVKKNIFSLFSDCMKNITICHVLQVMYTGIETTVLIVQTINILLNSIVINILLFSCNFMLGNGGNSFLSLSLNYKNSYYYKPTKTLLLLLSFPYLFYLFNNMHAMFYNLY